MIGAATAGGLSTPTQLVVCGAILVGLGLCGLYALWAAGNASAVALVIVTRLVAAVSLLGAYGAALAALGAGVGHRVGLYATAAAAGGLALTLAYFAGRASRSHYRPLRAALTADRRQRVLDRPMAGPS